MQDFEEKGRGKEEEVDRDTMDLRDLEEFFVDEDILFHDLRGDSDRMKRYLKYSPSQSGKTSKLLQNLPNRKGYFREVMDKRSYSTNSIEVGVFFLSSFRCCVVKREIF